MADDTITETEINDILAAAAVAGQALTALANDIDARLQDIDDTMFQQGRDKPTAAEQTEIGRLRAARDKLREDGSQLDFDTLVQLDRSQTVRDLTARLKTVNDGIKKTLDDLKRVEKVAATVAKAADALAKVASGLAGLAAKLA